MLSAVYLGHQNLYNFVTGCKFTWHVLSLEAKTIFFKITFPSFVTFAEHSKNFNKCLNKFGKIKYAISISFLLRTKKKYIDQALFSRIFMKYQLYILLDMHWKYPI